MRERFFKVVKYFGIILVTGLIYAGVCVFTGFGIPCVYREITGLKCPGCGLTHMIIDLLRLDFHSAFLENQFVFLIAPVILAAVLWHVFQYVRTGEVKLKKFENITCYVFIVLAVIWGIVRNI